MKDIKVIQEVNYDAERVGDLLCSAIEGGSNYWYYIIDHNRQEVGAEYLHEVPLTDDGFLVFCDKEEMDEHLRIPLHLTEFTPNEDTTSYKLTREGIAKGLETFRKDYPRHYSDWVQENDDACTGDVFLQCCLFGEVIFG